MPYSATDTLYEAEALIRKQHGVLTSDDWDFWHHIADWFNGLASRSSTSQIRGQREVRDFNLAVAAASQYINLWGPPEAEEEECDT